MNRGQPPSRLWAMLAALELPAILVTSPALLFPTPHRVWLVLLVPVTWIAHRRLGGRWIPNTPLNSSLLVLLTMTGVSLFATFDPIFSLGKVAGVVLGVLVFWGTTRWITNATRLQFSTAVFVLAGVGLSGAGLLGTNWSGKFAGLNTLIARLPPVIRGIPGAESGFQPNAVAGCLVLFIPLQVALLLITASESPAVNSRPAIRWPSSIQIGMLILTAGTLILTQSRGAGVGLFVAAVIVLFWIGRRTRALAAVIMGVVGTFAIARGPASLLEFAISRSGSGMASNLSSRTELWSRALYAIRDFPITGMGMNMFRRIMPARYPVFLMPPNMDIAHSHNHLLQAALDLGIPGLISYLAIWLGVAALLINVYRRSTLYYRRIAGGLGAGLIAHFAFSMTDTIPLGSKVGPLFWLTLALAVSLHQVTIGSDARHARIQSDAGDANANAYPD